MRPNRLPSGAGSRGWSAGLCLVVLLGCGGDAATGPTEPEPIPIGCGGAGDDWLLMSRSSGTSLRLTALALSCGAETVVVPQLRGSGAVSPDGSRLAYTDNGTLLIGSLESFAPVALATGPGAWQVSWSPDGSSLVFSADRANARDLFIVNADGTGLHPVFEAPAWRRRPAWSVTGRIAFELVHAGPMEDRTTIWSADPDGGNLVQLTSGLWDEAPAWSPDGMRLAFSRSVVLPDAFESQITVVNADGTGAETVVLGEGVGYPVWSPDGEWIVVSAPGGITATHLSGMSTIAVSDVAGQPLSWVAGFD